MGYKSVVISTACRLSVKNSQLIIMSDAEHSIPIEDIRTVMIENRSAVITAYTLCELSAAGVCVYLCDDKHVPCAFIQPYCQYSRQKHQLKLQLTQSKPSVKRMWHDIVVAKIVNQAKCLSLCRGQTDEYFKLITLAKAVGSGDPANVEGQAANIYFKALFGKSFTRELDCTENAFLNYGYAVVRGYICRKLADYGFEPCLGIHHCSQVNNFNLADDFIEPFRPLVDLYTFFNVTEADGLTPSGKRELSNILNYEMISGDEKHSAAYAIERLIHSYERCIGNETETAELVLPSIERLTRHEYE